MVFSRSLVLKSSSLAIPALVTMEYEGKSYTNLQHDKKTGDHPGGRYSR